MIDSVRLYTDIRLDDDDFNWNLWRRHIYSNGTINYFFHQERAWLRYYPSTHRLIIDGKLLTLLHATDVLNVDDCYGCNIENFIKDINDYINGLFVHSVLDIRSFHTTRLDYCINVKTPYVSLYLNLLNQAFRITNNGRRINYVQQRQLSGSVYIKTKHDYTHNERRNYVLNFYDKTDWLSKQRRAYYDIHPLDALWSKDVLRLEVQCGFQFLKELCTKLGNNRLFGDLLTYEASYRALQEIYDRIFNTDETQDFYTYAAAKRLLKRGERKAAQTLLAAARNQNIASPKFAYGRKQLSSKGIFPFAFLPKNSPVEVLENPLRLIHKKLLAIGAVEDYAKQTMI